MRHKTEAQIEDDLNAHHAQLLLAYIFDWVCVISLICGTFLAFFGG